MRLQTKRGSAFTAVFLVAGKCIGVGTLAIPIITGIAGFVPALFSTFIIWLYMMATGLLLLEATLGNPDGANFFTITKCFFGPLGRIISAVGFSFLFYFFLTSYFSLGTILITNIFTNLFGIAPLPFLTLLCLLILFGTLVFLGNYVSDKVNFVLMVGLLVAAAALLFFSYPYITIAYLKRQNWAYATFAIPVLFGALGYQTIIPTLSSYLNRNINKLRWTIIIGTTLPFLLYVLWQGVIIGILPEGKFWEAFEKGITSLTDIEFLNISSLLVLIGDFFAFFAIVTSLLTTGLAMVDFAGDGFKISFEKRTGWRRFLLCVLVFLPPFFLSQGLKALPMHPFEFIEGFLNIIFIGLLPIWMVWISRYRLHFLTPHILPGGKPLLLLLLIATFYLIYFQGIEVVHH